MTFNTEKLSSVAECDQALALANERKSSLLYQQTIADHDFTSQEKSIVLTKARLIGTNAEIVGTQAALDTLDEGEAKKAYQLMMTNLLTRKANLESRLAKASAAHVLDGELDNDLITLQRERIDDYVAAVNTRKAAL